MNYTHENVNLFELNDHKITGKYEIYINENHVELRFLDASNIQFMKNNIDSEFNGIIMPKNCKTIMLKKGIALTKSIDFRVITFEFMHIKNTDALALC
ncbi:hypothetical protein L3V83_14550 [Thiotrichales bacterium 19X7-9]|nr:hypothetical protein [Thiotrichales bacterium 19X7-9]